MFLFKRISYKTAFLIICAFFLTGFLLSLVTLLLCFCANSKSRHFIKKILGKNENRIENATDSSRVIVIHKTNLDNIVIEKRPVLDKTPQFKIENENMRRKASNFHNEYTNRRKSSAIQMVSYPLLDLSRVEAKYLKELPNSSNSKFKNYLRRSRKSFLGYETK
jgi:hypothetical protein